ncbi:hypothetical protein N7541_002457 [Penicillium brevicompactum]|uniref:Uncharacterized protein n=1 Tax=Penicillium brevicompactum TaxID=5074 RepID=A0A9W9UXX2_PENBR|nr:hypothetical protein N7541_002457 [Penicillium brevicompactum]
MSATTPLALTTTFSPPAACTTETWWVEYLTGSYYFTTSVTGPLSGWFFSQGPTDWSSCFPSGYQATTDFYYSPGVCPSGYSIASATTISLGTNTETRAACCPSRYTAQSNNNLVWYTANRCFSDNKDPDHVWTYSDGDSVTSITTSGGINAKAVFIRWQETDFQTTTTTASEVTSTRSVARNTASVSGPSATASTAISTDDTSSQQAEPSRAWIAGPVIGAVVACALIALVATWYNRRRWHQKNPVATEYAPQTAHELAYQPSHYMAELGQDPKVYEVPSQPIYSGPFELPAPKHR